MNIGIEAQRIFRTNPHGMDIFAIKLIAGLCEIPEIQSIVVFVNADSVKEGVLPRHPKLSIVAKSASYAYWEQWLLPLLVKRYEFDVFHFTSNTRSLRIKVPTVTTLHDIIFLDQHPLFRAGYNMYQRFGNWYRRLLVQRMMRSDDVLVTVSRSEAQRIQEKSIHTQIPFVYNGVASCFTKLPQEQVKAFLEDWKIAGPYILFLGNTDPKKNTERILSSFVEVAKQVQDVQFLIADYRMDDFKQLLGEHAERVLPRVKFLGYVDQKDLVHLYNGAAAFVYCSLAESFGIPIVEAFACHTPVLASNIPSLTEVSSGGALLVDPKDRSAISNGIIKLLNDKEFADRLTLKASEISKQYNWQYAAKQYAEIYKTLC